MFEKGKGVAADPEKAMALYLRAAGRGSATAQFNLGVAYAGGELVPKDCHLAVEWYQRAAGQGFAKAWYNMGVMAGEQCGPNGLEKEIPLLRRAADLGHAGAMRNIGTSYKTGKGGVAIDHQEAFQWFLKAAQAGDVASQGAVGYAYSIGRGVTEDHAQAAKWLRLSVAGGDTGALCNLGHLYDRGFGVPQDDVEARRLYLEAARFGDAACAFNAGVFARDGRGAPRDVAEAYFWFSLADRGEDKHPNAANRASLMRELLTPEQRAEAGRRLAAWKPKRP